MIIRRKYRKKERGQVLILCALFMVILLLFAGLAIDFGMAYVTRAELGKAADAAALTAARYSGQGTASATSLAKSAFAMNYNSSSLNYNAKIPPVVTITPASSSNGTYWTVTSSATNRTFFVGIIPGFNTLNVSSTATALAQTVEMTLVLDKSSSMTSDGGSAALPSAVTDFINLFDDVHDSVALVEFSTMATTVTKMTTGGFQQAVINDVNSIPWGGHTFSDAGLQQAFTQELQPVTGTVSKVVVFFTDGGANTIQNYMTCTGQKLPSGTYNYGGQDPATPTSSIAANAVSFMSPTVAEADLCELTSGNCCNVPGTFPSASTAGLAAPSWTSKGPSVTPWTGGTLIPTTHDNVQADAIYRAIGDATAMREAGITVYAIGLGTAPDTVDPQFLCQIANDPCSSAFNPSLPAGVYQGAATTEQLYQAFQTIASVIRLRLTQ